MQEVTPEKENEEVTDINALADDEGTPEEAIPGEMPEGRSETEETSDGDEYEEEDEDAQERIEELEALVNALTTEKLRSHADLENYKKRAERDKQESLKFAKKNVFLQILDVLDNFDRALTAVTDPKDNFVIGVNMIHKQLLDVLTQNGVEEVNSLGRLFDPYLDEALAKEPSTEHEENMVIEVFQKGYRFQGMLLRAAKVKVAAAPEESSPQETENETGEEA